jgi:TonB family protein
MRTNADGRQARPHWHGVLAVLTLVMGIGLTSRLWAQDKPQPAAPATAQTALEDPEWFKGAVRLNEPGVTAPVLVKRAQPSYTPEARDAGVEGDVHLDARIDENGRVTNVRVVKSIPLLDAQAEATAKQFEFRPARKNGVAVPTIVRIELAFRLRDKK